jgi:hypothetical protein
LWKSGDSFGVKILEIWQIGAIFFLKILFMCHIFQVKEKVKFVATTKNQKKNPIGTLWVCVLRIIYLLP